MTPAPRAFAAAAALAANVVIAGPAAAHATLVSASPAANASVDIGATEVILVFDAEVLPAGSGFTVTDPTDASVGAGSVDLEDPDRRMLSGSVRTSVIGDYVVSWTIVGLDGHEQSGSYSFTVADRAAVPDTALTAGPPSRIAVVAGLLLVGAAAAIAGRSRRRPIRAAAVLPLVLTATFLAACVENTAPDACTGSAELTMTLTRESLQPNDPAVCRDDDVTLLVDSEVDGVLHLHGYDEQVPATTVVAGERLVLAFTASRSGQFPIELHPEGDPQGVAVGIFSVHEP